MAAPVLVWLRRDLRLSDHPALAWAAASGRPVIPVFLRDETVEALGAAAQWRLGQGLERFRAALEAIGSRLILRSGSAHQVLPALVAETGATALVWSRYYDGPAVARDRAIKDWARASGLEVRSFNAHLLFEPWEVETGAGQPYQVYSAYWRAVRGRDVPAPLAPVTALLAPAAWPASEDLAIWRLGVRMRRGAAALARHAGVGEAVAQDRLAEFLDRRVEAYAAGRDRLDAEVTSGLSENLTWGEISPRTVWHAGLRAREAGASGAEKFLQELVWRDFAWHLFFHRPDMDRANWRDGWDSFAWRDDNPEAERWRQGRTGVALVDAAMREMYVTGRMHNRARMVVASFLTKHLLTHWRVGLDWFADCLTDWDPAANAMGWQWVAGSGPDAAPYFRIFNPDTQAQKFDPDGRYRHRWLAEGRRDPDPLALSYFDAIPESWRLSATDPPPRPVISLAEGRARALSAWENRG